MNTMFFYLSFATLPEFVVLDINNLINYVTNRVIFKNIIAIDYDVTQRMVVKSTLVDSVACVSHLIDLG